MTPSNPPSSGRPIRLEQLIVLHEEILSLVHAGVPLDSGLQLLGEDLPGRLGKIVRSLSVSLQLGCSLDEALDQHASDFPRIYRAVVRAGLRSGRLSLALESLSVGLSRIRDTRDFVMTSMIYPMIVIFVAIIGCLVLCTFVEPSIQSMFDDLAVGLPGSAIVNSFSILNPLLWIASGIMVLLILSFLSNWGKRSFSLVRQSAFSGLFALLPWSRRLMRNIRSGMFVEVLALLLKSRVPLEEAILLAGESVGDPRLVEGCRTLNEKIKNGEPIPAHVYRDLGIPPLASWALVMGQKEGDVVGLLEHASNTYKLQTEGVAGLLRQYTPVILTGLIAGGAVFVYVLWLFIPYVSLLKHLSSN